MTRRVGNPACGGASARGYLRDRAAASTCCVSRRIPPLAALCVLALLWPAQPAASATAGTGSAAGVVAARSPQVRADFNGDGFGDLVVGAPSDTVPGVAGEAHGTVSVLYGSASGVTVVDQLWHRDRRGVKGIASGMVLEDERECCPGFFGAVIAVGDFNGDGYDDLAASAWANRAHHGVPAQHASVNVIYGSARGLTARGDQLWSLASPGVKGIPGILEFQSLVAGDFNGDRRDDLVFDSQDQKYNTQIHMLPGSPKGLTADGDVLLRRSSLGVAGGGDFGQAMAVGNFDGDRDDDLAMAAFDDEKRRGSVSLFYGGRGGITGERDQLWTAASPGVPGARREFANFGSVLTAGDFDGDTRDELVVRDGGEDTARVLVLRGTSSGLTALGPTPVFRHTSSGLPPTKGRHRFGERMAAGDLTGDGRDELAIKDMLALMPEEAPCGDEIEPDAEDIGAGVLFVLQGSVQGLSTAGSQVVGASNLRFRGRTVPADVCLGEIASQLAFDDFDGDGYAELAMSYSAEPDLQGIAVVPGNPDGPQVAHAALWSAETPWIKARCCFRTLAQPQRSEWPS